MSISDLIFSGLIGRAIRAGLVLLVSVVGCQSVSQRDLNFETTVVEGLLSVSGPVTQSFKFNLRRELDGLERLELRSRLGLRLGEALFDGDQLIWLQVGDQMLNPGAAEQYLEETLSVDLPTNALTSWLRGKPHEPTTWESDSGFTEQGWTLQRSAFESRQSHQKFTIRKGELRVKVMLKVSTL
jgi:outer membrane biogenesis lipoprotein LolB